MAMTVFFLGRPPKNVDPFEKLRSFSEGATFFYGLIDSLPGLWCIFLCSDFFLDFFYHLRNQ